MGYRSKNTGISSPVTKYIEWKSNDKTFSFWDKEKEDRVELKMPLKFIALDDFFGVSGGTMDSNGQFIPVKSGIAAHLGKTIVVKKGDMTVATGIWKDIKEIVKDAGGRYTAYTYAIYKDELVCFKLAGAALAAWFEKKGDGDMITVKTSVEKKKGGITYNSPVFETEKLTDAQQKKLDASDELKAFDEYAEAKEAQKFAGAEEPAQAKEVQPDLSEDEVDESLEEKIDSDTSQW